MEHETAEAGLGAFWGDEPSSPASESAVVVSAPPAGALAASAQLAAVQPGASQEDRLLKLQDEIFEANLSITHDATRFREIGPADEQPPQAWVDELGEQAAWHRFRVARSAWMGAKDAPIALSMAKSIVSAMSKSAALRQSGGRVLNVEMAIFPVQVYERQVFHSDD